MGVESDDLATAISPTPGRIQALVCLAGEERLLATVASAVVFALLGLVARFIGAPLPLLPLDQLLQTILLWSGGGALAGVLLGLLFPKTMLCIAYPFSTLLDLEVGNVEVG